MGLRRLSGHGGGQYWGGWFALRDGVFALPPQPGDGDLPFNVAMAYHSRYSFHARGIQAAKHITFFLDRVGPWSPSILEPHEALVLGVISHPAADAPAQRAGSTECGPSDDEAACLPPVGDLEFVSRKLETLDLGNDK